MEKIVKNRSIVHDILKLEAVEMARFDELDKKCTEQVAASRKNCDQRIRTRKKELESEFEVQVQKHKDKCENELNGLRKTIENDLLQNRHSQDDVLKAMQLDIIRKVFCDD